MLDTILDVDPLLAPIERSIHDVLDSWRSDRAREYRKTHHITEDAGLAVIVQPMVAATGGGLAGSGVGLTRHPASGAPDPVIEFVERAFGTSLVSGNCIPIATEEIRSRWPDLFRELVTWCPILERVLGDMQEFEFAVENGRVCLLQTRRAKRTPRAALRVAYGLFQSGLISMDEAAELVGTSEAGRLVERHLTTAHSVPIGRGRVASPGVAVGRVAFDAAGAERILRTGDNFVLLTAVPSPADYPVIRRAVALVSSRGGITSHASVIALDAGIIAVVGCRELQVDRTNHAAHFGEIPITEGDWVSINAADEGEVFLGQLKEESPSLPADLSPELVDWADALSGYR